MKTIENIINTCEIKLKSGNANYRNTIECDWLLREMKVIKKEFEKLTQKQIK